MSWASYWWSRDSRALWWRQRWLKGSTITRTRDEKRRIGNTEMSVGISKNINILKKFCWISWTWNEDIKIQSVRWVCGIHVYFLSVELFEVRASKYLNHFQLMHLGRRPVTRRVTVQCECKGAPAWVKHIIYCLISDGVAFLARLML